MTTSSVSSLLSTTLLNPGVSTQTGATVDNTTDLNTDLYNTTYNAAANSADVPTLTPLDQSQVINYLAGVQDNTTNTLTLDTPDVIPSLSGIGTNTLSAYLQANTPGATAPIYPSGYLDSTGAVETPANLSAATFEGWNTGYQKEYLQYWAQKDGAASAYGTFLTIGQSTGNADIHVALSFNSYVNGSGATVTVPESQVNVITLENLTKTSFATLSYGDQLLITGQSSGVSGAPAGNDWLDGNPDNYNYMTATGTGLGLSTSASAAEQIVQNAIAEIVADAQTNGVPITINPTTYAVSALANSDSVMVVPSSSSSGGISFNTSSSMYDLLGNNLIDQTTGETLQAEGFIGTPNNFAYTTTQNALGDGRLLCYNDVNIFIQELQNELAKVKSMQVFSTTDITNAVSAIQTRYKDVSAFGSVPNQASAANVSIGVETNDPNVSSLHDGNNNVNNSSLLTANVVDADNDASQLASGSSTVLAVNTSSNNTVTIVAGGPFSADTADNYEAGDTGSTSLKDMSNSQTVPDGYSSSTNQSTVQQGYQALMNAETQILALNNQMNIIASTQNLASKQLDVPDMIFYIQLYTNLVDEQENAAATQIVNQQNDLLNAYSAMQQLINQIQTAFNPASSTEQLDIVGDSNSNDYVSNMLTTQSDAKFTLTTSQLDILSMFDSGIGAKGALNPIEKLYGITRPNFAFFDDGQNGSFDGKQYTSTSYNAFGTSLSDAVTQINQQTQIAMNNINELDQEKNQHFSLANNALTQAQTLYTTIGSYLDG